MGALGRTVVGRNRYARIIGLGDRRSPCVHTPCIVKIDGDPDIHQSIAPFSFFRDGSISPATLTLETLIEENKVEMIGGVNLPFLVKLGSIRNETEMKDLIEASVEAGHKYIGVATEILSKEEN